MQIRISRPERKEKIWRGRHRQVEQSDMHGSYALRPEKMEADTGALDDQLDGF